MSKQIYFLQPQVLDRFTVYSKPEEQVDESIISFVIRYKSVSGFGCYYFTQALKDLIEYNYYEN
jgi:hypothetical protein